MLATFAADPDGWREWRTFDHPQLGPVELGGLEYLRTIRNPPVPLLAGECAKGFTVADRLRRSLPDVRATLTIETEADDLRAVTLVLENVGFLPTSGLTLAETVGVAPPPSATLMTEDDAVLVHGPASAVLTHLDGWGSLQVSSPNLVYASLPARGHRAWARWWVRGPGPVTVHWDTGRGGQGTLTG
jgi:hypothetical protein